MPGLAVPLGDQVVSKLSQQCSVLTIPKLVILNERGETLTTDGVAGVKTLGAEGYPWKGYKASVCSGCTIC